jgi:hypothetical protein
MILFVVKCRNLSEFVTNASDIIIESMTELENEEEIKDIHLPIPV